MRVSKALRSVSRPFSHASAPALGQFGSFANDDVEVLIRLIPEEFEAYYAEHVLKGGGRAETALKRSWEAEAEVIRHA